MRTITFKGLFLTAVFMLLGSLAIQAADDDLITKQITIKLDEAGTLPNKIASSKKYLITNLKIVGEINGTDWDMIREMAGRDHRGGFTKGNLSVLDLSEAKIVEGGHDYYCPDYGYGYGSPKFTSNDVIGDCAFYGCSGLTSINLPASITEIGESAFYGCSGLTSINLPASITEISSEAFKGCSALKEVIFCINDLDTYLTKGHSYIHVDCDIKYYINDKEITSIEIPSNVTTLGHYVFQKCSTLTSINLPASITKIEYGAFEGCSGLTSIYVYAEKVPEMDSYVFEKCDAKKCTLYVPKGTYDDYWISEFGYFENIVEFDPTGIDKTTTSTDVKEVARYSVNGQLLVAPTNGLNIVKYSDGSVKKVAVQ